MMSFLKSSEKNGNNKTIIWCCFMLCFLVQSVNAQDLTISTSGETGTSGTNWSISGNELTVTGTATVNVSVITNHLETIGNLDVVANSSGSAQHIFIEGAINFTGNVSRTLTFVARNDVKINNSISSTNTSLHVIAKSGDNIEVSSTFSIVSNGGNIVLWANTDGNNLGNITVQPTSSIVSNGGGIWMGGGQTSAQWVPFDGATSITVGAASAISGTAIPFGVVIRGTVNAGTGNFYAAGVSNKIGTDYSTGVFFDANSSNIDIQAKNIKVIGQGSPNTGTAHSNRGVVVEIAANRIGTIQATAELYFEGTGSGTASTGSFNRGVHLLKNSAGTATITASTIYFKGTGAGATGSNFNDGVSLLGITLGNSQTTNIILEGRAGTFGTSTRAINFQENVSIGNQSSSATIQFLGDSFTYNNSVIATQGSVGILSTSPSFSTAFSNTSLSITGSPSSIIIGRLNNTSNINIVNPLTVAGSIAIYGGNINVSENLNTTAGATAGNVLLKASGDVLLAASKSITTNGGDVILWSNSDGQSTNGGVFFDQSSSITTGGGHIWIGGGSGTTTWNGLTVGNGYAVSGKNLIGLLTRTAQLIDWESGIFLNETTLNSGGGNIYMAGQRNTRISYDGGAGIINYNGTNGTTIDAGTGLIEIKGDGSHTGHVTLGFMSGLHPGETAGSLTIKSANTTSAQAIVILGSNATTNFPAFLVEDDTYILSTATSNGGGISLSGTLAGNNYGIWTQVGSLNVLSASGPISVDAGAKGIGLHVNTTFTNTLGQTISNTGHLYLGSRAGSPITSSLATIEAVSDRFITNTGSTINIASAGTLKAESKSITFSEAINTSQWNIGSNLTGLTIGKPTNTSNITFGSVITIDGPITAYGGTIALDADLTTTNNGNISLFTDNPLGGLSTPRTLTAAGAFKYIPIGTSFTADIVYPITNLTTTSTGLTIGNATNDKNITISADVTGGSGIELYGNNLAINANLKTTNGAAMTLKGNATIAARKYIESAGNFTHDGNLMFKSDINGTAAFGTLGGTYTTTSGTVTVERYIPARRAFRFVTSSVTTSGSIFENWQENGGTTAGLGTHITGAGGATDGFDTTATNNPSMFGFNHNTGQWAAVTNTNVNTLTAGTPYRLMVRGDRNTDLTTNTPTATATTLRATGSLKTGDFTPALNQASEGFSFIGNPYQAPLDMEEVLTNSASNMNTDVLYYWDPTLNVRGAYVTRTLSANTNTVPESSFTEILQPGQAVFVKKDNTATAATMTISETHKNVAAGAAGVFRTNANNTQSNAVGLLRANLQATIDNQWQTTDAALALFATSYTWDVTQEDATKMNNLDEEVSFVQNNTSLAIAKQNDASVTDELPIRLQQLRHTNYRWVFDLTNYSGNTPYLLDTEQNTLNVIENGTVFPFTAGSNATNRFKIVFQNTTLTTDDFLKNIKLYPNPAKAGASFYVAGLTEGTVSVYNVVGQNIPVTVMSQGNAIQVTPTATLSQGIYLVSVTTTDGKTAQVKWIVE